MELTDYRNKPLLQHFSFAFSRLFLLGRADYGRFGSPSAMEGLQKLVLRIVPLVSYEYRFVFQWNKSCLVCQNVGFCFVGVFVWFVGRESQNDKQIRKNTKAHPTTQTSRLRKILFAIGKVEGLQQRRRGIKLIMLKSIIPHKTIQIHHTSKRPGGPYLIRLRQHVPSGGSAISFVKITSDNHLSIQSKRKTKRLLQF